MKKLYKFTNDNAYNREQLRQYDHCPAIYLIQNNVTKDAYIGASMNLGKRIRNHLIKQYNHPEYTLYLLHVSDYKELFKWEVFYINYYKDLIHLWNKTEPKPSGYTPNHLNHTNEQLLKFKSKFNSIRSKPISDGPVIDFISIKHAAAYYQLHRNSVTTALNSGKPAKEIIFTRLN